MTGKRIFAILGFGVLVAGTLTALWLMTLPAQQRTSSHIAVDQRAEKERQHHGVVQQAALKQQRLEERQLADAQRLAEQEQQQREVERKQLRDIENRRLADVVRALETERLRQAEIVQASLKHRENEELKIAEARRIAEQEGHRREAEVKEASRQQRLEEERRLSDVVRQLEKERVRQADVVQASIRQRLDTDRRQVAAATIPATAKADAGVMESRAKPARLKAAKYHTPSGGKVGRPRKCSRSCAADSRRGRNTGPSHSRRQAPAAGESGAYLCPWRWFEGVIAELIGPIRVAERSIARRTS